MAAIEGTVLDDTGVAVAAARTVRVYRRDTGALLGSGVTGGQKYTNTKQEFVKFHCHFDGANLATAAVDKSGNAHAITFNGGATLSTAVAAFGSASSLASGASKNVTVPSNAMFAIGTGDFEIFAAINMTTLLTSNDSFNIGNYTAGVLVRCTSGVLTLWVNGASNSWSKAFSATTTYYIRIWRDNGVISASVDGTVLTGTWANTANIPTGILTIGTSQHAAASEYINGYVDEVRLMVGGFNGNSTVTANLSDIDSFTTLAAGAYSVELHAFTGEVQRLVLDDAAGTLYNDLIDRVIIA